MKSNAKTCCGRATEVCGDRAPESYPVHSA